MSTGSPTDRDHPVTPRSARGDIDRFLSQAETTPAAQGRLIFALDATMSRQPTWDRACRLQGEMFSAVAASGRLSVQLLYYRGLSECRASRWALDADTLRGFMMRIACQGGHTQIAKVLGHARKEMGHQRVNALVFIGDAMEENADDLSVLAGELGVLGLPCFMVQEGANTGVEAVFREIARLSGGAYLRLDEGSADALARLLRAVAAYATGGLTALEAEDSREGRLLIGQLRSSGSSSS
ncbi:hypothetical protein SAMN05428963_11632 [Consotaella salsifontis]|uniref:VWA domain-containing protein n=2 Tax=Consotaella salsifontis TaxID=1365950 RepID=A0A1T4SZB2_9HYPH|nr:hypothetical protein SAMN05428963_11632 [Consotaella salsifontis]